MSKLLGIVNPNVDPSHEFDYWLWRGNEVPWEAEQLTIEHMAVEGGNVQFRVIGPHTPRYPDGVFVKIQINPALNPTPLIVGEPQGPWADPRPVQAILTPQTPGAEGISPPDDPWSGQGRL